MWCLHRIKESNGWVAKRILRQCVYYMSVVNGFSVEKDGRIIIDFFKAADIFREKHKLFL